MSRPFFGLLTTSPHTARNRGMQRVPERFELLRRLGAGDFGVVHAAYDQLRDAPVAVKTLHSADPNSIFRLKTEFRTVSEVHHRNLASLYELLHEDDGWHVTMELIDGVDIVQRLRRNRRLDYAEVRDAFGQLVDGLTALHDVGALHRDIKASNVLVDQNGRVALLDFGLAAPHFDAGVASLSGSRALLGTIPYMAPELFRGNAACAQTDLYAVGVLLFEVLTGTLPFSGSLVEILSAKSQENAPTPHEIERSIPPDLALLCTALLEPKAEWRPTIQATRRSLETGVFQGRVAPACDKPERFVGRKHELGILRKALEETCAGQSTVVAVTGASGIGKTTMVRHFLRDVDDALCLAGRCYDGARLPYIAIDEIVDRVACYLRQCPAETIRNLIPESIGSLARAFPVLDSVPAVRDAPSRRFEPVNAEESLVRAIRAFELLLARISVERPLAIWIDDFQWADIDSLDFIRAVLRNTSHRILWITTCRVVPEHTLPAISELATQARVVELDLKPMPDDEAQALIDAVASRPVDSNSIIRNAAGSPFLLQALARNDGDMEAAVRRCSSAARRVLDILAMSDGPMRETVVLRSAGIEGSDRPEAILELRKAHFIRRSSTETISMYHDQVRSMVRRNIDAEQTQRLNAQIAETLAVLAPDEHYRRYLFHHRAGAYPQAADNAILAARHAESLLAFDQAVMLYRSTIAMLEDDARIAKIWDDLGRVLLCSGRGAEAAVVYGRIVQEGGGVEGQLKVAESFLSVGMFEEGATALGAVLERFGYKMTDQETSFAEAETLRLQLMQRGADFVPRMESDLKPEERIELESLRLAALGFLFADTVLGAKLQLHCLLRALEVGEPGRIATAMAVMAIYTAMLPGPQSPDMVSALLAQSRMVGEQVEDAEIPATTSFAAGVSEVILMQHGPAEGELRKAEALLLACPNRVPWEIAIARIGLLHAMFHTGNFKTLRSRFAEYLADAHTRRDVQTLQFLELTLPQQPLRGVELPGLEEMIGRFRDGPDLLITDGLAMMGVLDRGPATDLLRTAEFIEHAAARYRSSRLRFPALCSWIESGVARLRLRLIGAEPSNANHHKEQARDAILRLREVGTSFTTAQANQLEGLLLIKNGERASAAEMLRESASAFESLGAMTHAWISAARQSDVCDDRDTLARSAAARRAIEDAGIDDVDAFIQHWAP